MFRRCITIAVWFGLLAGTGILAPFFSVRAQEQPPVKEKPAIPAPSPAQDKKAPQEKAGVPEKQITAEGVAEGTIYFNGTREGLAQIRKTGIERGRITRAIADGKTEEATYERRFIRGESIEKDRIRFDQKMPTAEYALVFVGGQVWGIINEAIFTPRQETSEEFLSRQWHGIDTLLRYKENGSTLNYIGKEQQKGIDLYVIDVTDKEQRRTRFYISAKKLRVLWLEYTQTPDSGGEPVKFVRKFHDYRVAQGTLVPFRVVLYKDGTEIEETHVLTITFGPKIDEALFQNPQATSATTAATP